MKLMVSSSRCSKNGIRNNSHHGYCCWSSRVLMVVVVVASLLVLPNNRNMVVAVQYQDPSSLIGAQCYNDTVTLASNQNDSLIALYIGFFNGFGQNNGKCSFDASDKVACSIDGTELTNQVTPICAKLGGQSYTQNFTVVCSEVVGVAADYLNGKQLQVTAFNFSGCAAISCGNLTTLTTTTTTISTKSSSSSNASAFLKYNLDPTYRNSLASFAASAFYQYGFSSCQFTSVDNVPTTVLQPSTTPSSGAAAALATPYHYYDWMPSQIPFAVLTSVLLVSSSWLLL